MHSDVMMLPRLASHSTRECCGLYLEHIRGCHGDFTRGSIVRRTNHGRGDKGQSHKCQWSYTVDVVLDTGTVALLVLGFTSSRTLRRSLRRSVESCTIVRTVISEQLIRRKIRNRADRHKRLSAGRAMRHGCAVLYLTLKSNGHSGRVSSYQPLKL